MLTTTKVNWKKGFLARCAIWDWYDSEHIYVLGKKGEISLNKWQTLVFHEANGNRTIEQMISWFPSQYKDQTCIPTGYVDDMLIAAEELLFKIQVVELWERKDDLAYYFELPKSEQNEAESLQLMKEDGEVV